MDKIKILGYEYTVDSSKPLSEMGENIGYCDFNYNIITVANDVSDNVFNSVLLHEIIEAISYHLDIGLEEKQVKQLEAGLHQIVKIKEDAWLNQ